MSWKYGDNDDDDDDDDDDENDNQDEEWISENIYFWISLQNPPLVTVQQYFCTLSHSQKSVQAAIQHVNSPEQKSPYMTFHWSGGTVTVVKHKMCPSLHECQHVSAISLICRWQKIINLYVSFKQHHTLISEDGCLIVLLSHNDCLAEFCIYQAIKSQHTFLISLSDISVCCVKCWKMFIETVTCWQCGNMWNYINSVITTFLIISHLTVWQSWRVDWVGVQ